MKPGYTCIQQPQKGRAWYGRPLRNHTHASLSTWNWQDRWCSPHFGIQRVSVCRICRPGCDSYNWPILRYTLFWLWNAIKWKWPGLFSAAVLLLHDYVRPHTAEIVKFLLADLKWVGGVQPSGVFARHHPFQLLPLSGAEIGLRWMMFRDNDCVTKARKCVTLYFKNLDTAYYLRSTHKLADHYEKCPDQFGDYIKK